MAEQHRSPLTSFPDSVMRAKLDQYKVDEGYSEDTRSEAEVMQIQPSLAASIEDAIRGLSDYERSEIAYGILRGLRAASIARVFDRLWPAFHKDPIEQFPAEITSLILSFFRPRDLLTASLVSKQWHSRVMESSLWREKFTSEGWTFDAKAVEQYEKACNFGRLPSSKSPSQTPLKDRTSRGSTLHDRTGGAALMNTKIEPNGGSYTNSNAPHSEDEEMTDADIEMSQSEISNRRASTDVTRTPTLYTESFEGGIRLDHRFLYKQRRRLEANWDKGRYTNFQLPHRDYPQDAHEECVYTIQYEGNFLVSGSRDRTLRIWDLTTGRLTRRPLRGHTGSVLCLQFDSRPEEDLIVSGSGDTNVIFWRFSTGEMLKKIVGAHDESVLNLRFDHRYLVTCSKDKTIKVWNRHALRPGQPDYPLKGMRNGARFPDYIIDAASIKDTLRNTPSHDHQNLEIEPYMLLMTLDLHDRAVNAIQIYQDQLVSASGDRNLRMWDIHTGECLFKVQAHDRGIACVQYDGKRIVSGSSDNTIRIWDPATRAEVARLEGHTRLVRTLQAAFIDTPGGRDELEEQAAEVDRQWQRAKAAGENLSDLHRLKPSRPGSRKPRDIRALNAKIPPSGGGSRWARIVSGSYDEKVIIWKKTPEDEWVIGHQLAQDAALTAAGPPLSMGPMMRQDMLEMSQPVVGDDAPPVGANAMPAARHVNTQVDGPGEGNAHGAGTAQPGPSHTNSHQGVIPPHERRSALSDGIAHPRHRIPRQHHGGQGQASSLDEPAPAEANQAAAPAEEQQHPIARHLGQPRVPHGDVAANARVFKLQFDVRRIVCCSQDNKIVGWDFANGDREIENACRFFADPQ